MKSAAERHFDELYEEHFRPVLAYCLRRSPAQDGYDAANEVFAIAWRRIEDVPHGDAALPWLHELPLQRPHPDRAGRRDTRARKHKHRSRLCLAFNIPASELAAELALAPLGTSMALSSDDPIPAGSMAGSVSADPGSEISVPLTLLPGTHFIDCLRYESASDVTPSHVWRSQTTIEVVAP